NLFQRSPMALVGRCLRRCLLLRPPQTAGFSAAAAPAAAAAAPGPPASAADSPLNWQPAKNVTMEQSLRIDDYFQVNRLVSKRQLMEHRVHLGHKAGCRSEWMTPSLFGCRCGVDIIDLEQTAPLLRRALNFTAHVAARGGIVLFLWQGWPALSPLVERRAAEMGEFAYTRPWVDQAVTDAATYFDTATRLPDLAVFLSCMSPVMLPHPAIAACAKVMIPTVGICDSNSDPRLVTYPVPGNDDSPQAIQLYMALFAETIRRGKAAFAQWSAEAPQGSSAGDKEASFAADPRDAFRRVQSQALRPPEQPMDSAGADAAGSASQQRQSRQRSEPRQQPLRPSARRPQSPDSHRKPRAPPPPPRDELD
uniref:Ribosomal_S2 domain-containing protein n=2 Tax=Macrostomum lignano TaxID=282301 RepID=A0A1I8GUD9_9PLAT